MSSKIEFVEKATRPGASISALCREYGISRQTGHKWLRRYRSGGFEELEERSRRPDAAPLATAEDVIMELLELRLKHPSWGARKLTGLLGKKFKTPPSERTVARILKRFGLLRRRRRQARGEHVVAGAPKVTASAPNEVWTVDFKGWWRARDGGRCEPLTVRDAFSRYVLAIVITPDTSIASVRAVFARVFRRYGVPAAIQCDNGSPFANVQTRGGLTRLSAWWVSLGIRIVRSRPGCPQDNGGHERMHADVARDVQAFPAATPRLQQRACDRWRQVFNHVRPHDALGGRTPAELYKASSRKPTEQPAAYAEQWQTRRVTNNGRIYLGHDSYFVSEALCGQVVALEPREGLIHRIWFHNVDLGDIEIAPSQLPGPVVRRLLAA